jgi:hypothetical protein
MFAISHFFKTKQSAQANAIRCTCLRCVLTDIVSRGAKDFLLAFTAESGLMIPCLRMALARIEP